MTARTSTPVGSQWDTVWSGYRVSTLVGRQWDESWANADLETPGMGHPAVMEAAAEWLDKPEIIGIADWGCGHGQFIWYIAPHQIYTGFDACAESNADVIMDLREWAGFSDGVYLRGILEHNDDWEAILTNFLHSFRFRAILVFAFDFTDKPWRENGKFLTQSFSRSQILPYIESTKKRERQIPRQRPPQGHETLFFLEK